MDDYAAVDDLPDDGRSARYLDDADAGPCGQCDNCTGASLAIDLAPAVVRDAVDVPALDRSSSSSPASSCPTGSGSRPTASRVRPGARRCGATAGGASLVRRGRLVTGRFDDQLVDAAADLIRRAVEARSVPDVGDVRAVAAQSRRCVADFARPAGRRARAALRGGGGQGARHRTAEDRCTTARSSTATSGARSRCRGRRPAGPGAPRRRPRRLPVDDHRHRLEAARRRVRAGLPVRPGRHRGTVDVSMSREPGVSSGDPCTVLLVEPVGDRRAPAAEGVGVLAALRSDRWTVRRASLLGQPDERSRQRARAGPRSGPARRRTARTGDGHRLRARSASTSPASRR